MSYIIKRFMGGLSDFNHKGIEGSFKFGANLDIRKSSDTLSCKQALTDEGLVDTHSPSASVSPSTSASSSASLSASASASPTPSPSASASPSVSVSLSPSTTGSSSVSLSISPSKELTSVFRDLIRWFVKATDGYTYGFGSTGYIYRRDSDGYWLTVYKDPDGAIKGAEEKPSSTGKTYLQWATNTKLKQKPLPGLSNWNDVEVVAGGGASTGASLNSADWHTMKQIGGANYICNGPWLAMSGYDDSYTNEALDLIPGNISKTLVERSGRPIIGTYRNSDSSKGINAAIDTEVPLAQIGTDGELFFANMSDSIPDKKFPGGGQVNPGGVTNEIDQAFMFEWDGDSLSWIDKQTIGNMSLWAVYDADSGKGGIYSYGRYKKSHSFVLNLDYQFDADELGALTSIDGLVLVSYKDGSTYGVKKVDSTAKAIATYEGLELPWSDKKKALDITHWTTAEIYCEPLPDGASIEFWFKLNATEDFIRAYMEDETQSFQAYGERKAVFFINAEAEILEPRVVLNPVGNTSPEITRIIIRTK